MEFMKKGMIDCGVIDKSALMRVDWKSRTHKVSASRWDTCFDDYDDDGYQIKQCQCQLL